VVRPGVVSSVIAGGEPASRLPHREEPHASQARA